MGWPSFPQSKYLLLHIIKKYKGGKNWLGGEKTDWGEIPACYTGTSHVQQKRWTMYISGDGDQGYKWLVHYSTVFGCGSTFRQCSCRASFSVVDIKHACRTLLKIKPRNKDDLAMKNWQRWQFTRTNVFAQAIFGAFLSFVWTREKMLFVKVTLVKINFIWQSLCPV